MPAYWRLVLNRALRRTAFGAVGAVFFLLGLGFLTVAFWLALALAYGGVVASVIVGLCFCGVGLICLAFATRRSAPPPAPLPRNDLLSAFLGGLNTGKAIVRRSSPPR